MPIPRDALDRYLQLPATDQGYQTARAWFTARRGASAGLADIVTADRDEFLGYFAQTYCGIVSRAIRKYDPNHMYLGSRINHLELPYQFYQGAGPFLDAVSVNYYRAWTPVRRVPGLISVNAGKPILLTEWYAKGDDAGYRNTSGAGWIVPTQRERGYFYQHSALAMLESRMCIGWQWFKYMDNDTTDTSAELSNTDSNKGIVTTTYRPYTAMLDEMQKLNCRVYAVAAYFDAITPVAPALSVLPSQPQSHGWVLRIAPVQRSVPVGAAFLLDGRLPGNVPACGTRTKARAAR